MIAEVETERTVVGAVLVHPKVIVDLGSVRAEFFTRDELRRAWKAIADLDNEGKPFDALSVSLRSGVSIDSLTALMAEVVTVENIGYYAGRLSAAYRRREIERAANKILVDARDASIDHADFINDAQRAMLDLSTDSIDADGPVHVKSVLKEVSDRIEKRSERKSISGISTGSAALDHVTDGFQQEDLVVIAARPSMGKTARALRIISHCAKNVVPSLVFSLEMRRQALIERLVSAESNVTKHALRRGTLNTTDWIAFQRGLSKMSVWPTWIDDRGGLDVNEIRSTARRWHARLSGSCVNCQAVVEACGHRLIVVDHMSLIQPPRQQMQTREREVAYASMMLKQVAKELKVCVVLLCQLNRSLEARADKRPMMSDLRESGAIEQDADLVLFLYRDVVYNPGADKQASELIIGKQRDGATTVLHERWIAETQMFVDA